jgi:transposase
MNPEEPVVATGHVDLVDPRLGGSLIQSGLLKAALERSDVSDGEWAIIGSLLRAKTCSGAASCRSFLPRRAATSEFRRYRDRNQVVRLFNRLKQSRRIATRYDKTAASFLGFQALAKPLFNRISPFIISSTSKNQFGV